MYGGIFRGENEEMMVGIFPNITVGSILAGMIAVWKLVFAQKMNKKKEREKFQTQSKEFRLLDKEIRHALDEINLHEKLQALFLQEFQNSQKVFSNTSIKSYKNHTPPFHNFSIKPQTYEEAEQLFIYYLKDLEDIAAEIYQGSGYAHHLREKKPGYSRKENKVWNDIQYIKARFSESLLPLLSWSNLSHSVYFVHIAQFPNLFMLQQNILNPHKFQAHPETYYRKYAKSYLEFIFYSAAVLMPQVIFFYDYLTSPLGTFLRRYHMHQDPLLQPPHSPSISMMEQLIHIKDSVQGRMREQYPRFQDILMYFLSLHTEAIERSAYAKASPLWKEIHDIQEYLNQRLQAMDAEFSAHGFFIKPRP